MGSHEDAKKHFEKIKNESYEKSKALAEAGAENELFGKPVGEEPKTVTVSAEGLRKLLYAYGRLHGIGSEKLKDIIEGPEANGDVYLAKLRFAYAEMCRERGFVPRGYLGKN